MDAMRTGCPRDLHKSHNIRLKKIYVLVVRWLWGLSILMTIQKIKHSGERLHYENGTDGVNLLCSSRDESPDSSAVSPDHLLSKVWILLKNWTKQKTNKQKVDEWDVSLGESIYFYRQMEVRRQFLGDCFLLSFAGLQDQNHLLWLGSSCFVILRNFAGPLTSMCVILDVYH